MPDDDEDGLTGVGIDVANALVDNPRVVIRAGAGAGRTTLLQWLAAKLADRMVWTRGGYLPSGRALLLVDGWPPTRCWPD